MPDAAKYKPLCEILGITVNELFSGERLSSETESEAKDYLLDLLASRLYEEGEEDSGTSGSLTLDGEAKRNRGGTTYNSLLDINGVTDLFSEESTDRYNERQQEAYTEQQELKEYLFAGQTKPESAEGNEVDMIFSEEIMLSRSGDYRKSEEDYSVCYVMAEIIFVLIFLYILIKINAGRKKRREADAVKIDMESRRAV